MTSRYFYLASLVSLFFEWRMRVSEFFFREYQKVFARSRGAVL